MPVNQNKPGITVCEQLSGIHLCIHMNCYGHRISEERFATQVSNKSQQHPIDKLSEQDITRKTQACFFLPMLQTVLYFSMLVEALSPTSGFRNEPSYCRAISASCCRCPLCASVVHQFSASVLECCAEQPKHAKSKPALRPKRADHICCNHDQSAEHELCICE